MEAISNGVPAFRKPKSKNAASTLAAMGIIAVVMFAGVTTLAIVAKVHITGNSCRLSGIGGSCEAFTQKTVIAQLASAVFGGDHSIGFFFIQAATALVLVLAANTAFNGFPLLSSILAQHRYLPRQLHTRGDRLAFSNGILALAVVAGALLGRTRRTSPASSTSTSWACSPPSRSPSSAWSSHWNRLCHRVGPGYASPPPVGTGDQRLGAVITALVLVIVLITKFTQGAWLAVVAAVLCG